MIISEFQWSLVNIVSLVIYQMVYNLLVAYYYELISSMILIVAFDMYSIHTVYD